MLNQPHSVCVAKKPSALLDDVLLLADIPENTQGFGYRLFSFQREECDIQDNAQTRLKPAYKPN
jgi:hypothetical protein